MGTALVDKDELLGVEPDDRRAPSCPRLLVALAGCHCFFYVSSPDGAWLATWWPRSTPGRSAPPTRHSAPAPSRRARLPAARANWLPAPGQCGAGSRKSVCAPGNPSRAVAPRRVSPYSRPLQSGARLLAWADPLPPRAPGVLSGRSNRHAYLGAPHTWELRIPGSSAYLGAPHTWELRIPGSSAYLGAPHTWELRIPGSSAYLGAPHTWELRIPGSSAYLGAPHTWELRIPGSSAYLGAPHTWELRIPGSSAYLGAPHTWELRIPGSSAYLGAPHTWELRITHACHCFSQVALRK
ncbi:MAG: hypothetical protein OJF49_004781 [Ktedonobacterales bacterium]|nr:MAG: hypothetical protein OJF49_004781 [Ktedonobacterales bacterium]